MFKFQQPEDQTKFCLPLNRDTESLYYNTYLVIDANVLTEPRVWMISKINRSNSKGIAIFTCTQELANQHTLKADYDEDGNIIAWWADWNENNIDPVPAITDDDLIFNDDTESPSQSSSTITSIITCSGKKVIKIGGSAKTLTVTFKDEENEIDRPIDGWSFFIGDDILPNDLLLLTPVSDNKVKVKFLGDDSFIGKILTVKCKSGDVEASLDIELQAL